MSEKKNKQHSFTNYLLILITILLIGILSHLCILGVGLNKVVKFVGG